MISKTYDQDQDADLWRESGSFLKKKTLRYLCLSKTEGLPNFVLKEIHVVNDKSLPPEGYSLLNKTADSEQKAWRKKQICYKLSNKNNIKLAITDIIICSRLKKAPEGFTLAGEINGVIVCYKMGNAQDTQNGGAAAGVNAQNIDRPPDRPPKPTSGAYPSLSDDGDYEILNPSVIPGYRPAPPPPTGVQPHRPPVQHQTSTLNSHFGVLEGVPFVLSPRLTNNRNSTKPQIPIIKARSRAQVLKDYNYDFRLERHSVI